MKMENTNLNMPNVTVAEIVDILSMLYTDAVNKDVCFKRIATPFLWGPAGVGKSQAIEQLANKLQDTTGKTTIITDVRLLLFSPVDLRGVPIADQEKKFCNWLMPKIFDMNMGNDNINILFLDELSAAPVSVQAAAYQICLDRKIGEHKLPDNCIVIAAGNRTTDQSVSYKMPKALCNRLMHFNIVTNYEAWLKWAVANDIDNRIIGYLAFADNKLCLEPESSDMAYPTPRSWAFVSDLLKTTDVDVSKMHALIGACVGVDTAIEFETWVKTHKELPKVNDVLSGKVFKYPKTNDAMLAFVASIVSAIRNHPDQISAHELENACAYISKIPTDFAMTFYTDLNSIESIRLKLMKSPSCKEWFAKNKGFV